MGYGLFAADVKNKSCECLGFFKKMENDNF